MRKIFLAGIMQGSLMDKSVHSQDYRQRIKSALREVFPEAQIYDPLVGNENSVFYDDGKGREVFLKSIEEAKSSDLLIAYLPQASLGTAIEIWECYKRKMPIWTISPMVNNWVIRFCSTRNFENIDDFCEYVKDTFDLRKEICRPTSIGAEFVAKDLKSSRE